jgi:hypothetical protein
VADVVVPVDTDPVAYAKTAEAAAAGELVHVLVRSVAKTGKVSDPDCMTAVAFNKLLNDWMRAEWKLHTLEFTQGNESYWNVAVVFTK